MSLACLLVSACRPARTTEPEPNLEPAPAPAMRARHTDGSPMVAVATSPVQLLPDTTVAVGSVAGIGALLAVVDVEAIIGKYRSHYDQMSALISGSTGFNLLDPAQWREVGIDPDGPMGAAMLDMRSETVAGFITLSDPAKFRAFIDKLGGEKRLRPVIEDRGLVLKREPDSNTALVLRDGFLFVVTTDRPNEAPYDFARLLATIDPARGLTASPRYQRAIASPEPPRPLTAYVDLWAIVQGQEVAREARARDTEPSWAEQELERAVQAGASAQEQARLRQQADEQRAWDKRHEQRRQREFELLRRWLAPVEPVVFELTASRGGVEGKIRAKMPETAPLRAVLQNAAMPSPVLSALGERAVLQLGGSVDVVAAIASFEDIVRASGDEPQKAYDELRRTLLVDLKTEVAPLLTGTGGFALTVSEALLRGEAKGEGKELGFALAVAVRDVPAAQALLARLVQRAPIKAGKDAKTGAYMLSVPGYRTVHATVTAGQIVMTTDPGVIRRLGAGSPASHGVPAAVVPVVTARDVGFVGMFDVVLPMFLLGARTSSVYMNTGDLFQPSVFPGVDAQTIEKVPRSRAYKTKLRAWEALNTKILKEEQAQERRRMQLMLALAECFGVMAGNLREQPDGLELAGGQFFGKGGLTRALDLGVEQLTVTRGSERTWELYGQKSALEEELRRIRTADVATALRLPMPLE
ncbi:MAG TPA: hypothetical protein VGB85_07395 [Nannocystis sp.]